MSVHSAITSFVEQGTDDVSVSTISCLAAGLAEPGVAQNLVDKHRPLCCEVMSRLVSVANDSSKNPNVRIISMECLYSLSNIHDNSFRRGDLFTAVQKLNESFEAFLEGQVSNQPGAADSQHEILTILLFRCCGYNRLSAGDLLQQIFAGDDTRLVATLQSIMKKRSLEWDIMHACMRCLYQLTTPASYFTAGDDSQPIETTKISAFQDKIATLLRHLTQCNALEELFSEISGRWAEAVSEAQLGSIIEGNAPVSAAVLDHIAMNFVLVFRYISVMLLNVADFCEMLEAVRSYQHSFMDVHQNFISDTVIPFVRLAIRCWEATRDPSAAADSQDNPYMNGALGALRLLRFTLYRQSAPTLQENLTKALSGLTQQVHDMERPLCSEYVGMLVLVLTTECLCNANAIAVPALATNFTELITYVAGDTNPLRPGAQFTASQAFAYCIANETSTYCVSENESVDFLRSKVGDEDAVLVGEAAMAIRALEEQLGMLQTLMMELAIGQLLGDLCLMIPGVGGSATMDVLTSGASEQPRASSEGNAERSRMDKKSKSTGKKKHKHPPQYVCLLTKKLMREPVVLSNGNRYELDALQKVVDRVGHVDPITGETFNDELIVDMALQQEIARYKVEMAARGEATVIA
ncbi:U box domain [Trypanosoma vivax]|nr:hypothetical protein TRVL_00969 [Trypanosoma vivax]KAH8611446.1 U box domain [Trypanosoma vivax]